MASLSLESIDRLYKTYVIDLVFFLVYGHMTPPSILTNLINFF